MAGPRLEINKGQPGWPHTEQSDSTLAVGRCALLEKLHSIKVLDLPLYTSLDPDSPLLRTKFSNVCSKTTFTNYCILKC